jgi:hypothetical protein
MVSMARLVSGFGSKWESEITRAALWSMTGNTAQAYQSLRMFVQNALEQDDSHIGTVVPAICTMAQV